MRRATLLAIIAALALSGAAHAVDYYAFTGTAKNASGVAIASATVTVYSQSTGLAATIYSDGSGTPTTNPLTANGSGVYSFYGTSGKYRIVAVDGSAHAFTAYITLPSGSSQLLAMKGTCRPASGTESVVFNTSGVASCSSAAGGGNSFTTIDASSGTDPVADSSTDTLVVTGTAPIVVTGSSAGDSLTISLSTPVATASALAANGANCSAGSFPLGVDASGAVESCSTSVSGSAATLTTPRAIYGNNFDGSAALTQIIASTYGGTGNGFTKFSGPTSTEKTFTLPDASSTIIVGSLGSNADYATCASGTGGVTAKACTAAVVKLGNSNFLMDNGFGQATVVSDPASPTAGQGDWIAGRFYSRSAGTNYVSITPEGVRLFPTASPPATCDSGNEGSMYSDTSHALCFCDGSAWTKVIGAGTCS